MNFSHFIDAKGAGDDIELIVEVDFDHEDTKLEEGQAPQPTVVIESVDRWDADALKYVPYALNENEMHAIIAEALEKGGYV